MSDRRRTRTPHRPPTIEAHRWTLKEVTALGATTDVVTAGQILGMSRKTLVNKGFGWSAATVKIDDRVRFRRGGVT